MLAFLLISVSLLTLIDFGHDDHNNDDISTPDDKNNIVEGKTDGLEIVSLYDGDDSYVSHGADHTVYAGRGNDEYLFTDENVIAPTEATFWGSSGNDTMTVNTLSDSNITLFGGSGNDVFIEDNNPNTIMYGGKGDDTFMIDQATWIDGGSGNDVFNLTVSSDNLVDDIPTISFDKASDSLYIELEGFAEDSIQFEVNSDQNGVFGTTLKVGDVPFAFLLNETGMPNNAIDHLMDNLQVKFI